MGLFSLLRSKPDRIGLSGGRLAPCPSRPNCVCSDSIERGHRVGPYSLRLPPGEAWEIVRQVLERLPRTRVVERTDDYLRAECRSAIFGFVDDFELHLRPGSGRIAVRSASRLGYSDLGVNRRRVERLRSSLRRRGVIR